MKSICPPVIWKGIEGDALSFHMDVRRRARVLENVKFAHGGGRNYSRGESFGGYRLNNQILAERTCETLDFRVVHAHGIVPGVRIEKVDPESSTGAAEDATDEHAATAAGDAPLAPVRVIGLNEFDTENEVKNALVTRVASMLRYSSDNHVTAQVNLIYLTPKSHASVSLYSCPGYYSTHAVNLLANCLERDWSRL